MRWEDERYVRVFTRDTPDWCALSWEAQALFLFLLRRVDRAGLVPLGRSGARGLAGMVGMPVEVVERALPELLADGCVQQSGTTLVIPNFVAAQESPQSDKLRARSIASGYLRQLSFPVSPAFVACSKVHVIFVGSGSSTRSVS